MERQRADDGDALLLAAGEFVRIPLQLVAEPHLGEQGASLLLHLLAGRFLILTGATQTFSSTVMFWNRLYCWNTMAMRSRRRRTCAASR